MENLFKVRVLGSINIPRYNIPCPAVLIENQDFITILKNSGFTVDILEEVEHSRISSNKPEEVVKESKKVESTDNKETESKAKKETVKEKEVESTKEKETTTNSKRNTQKSKAKK